MSTRNEIWYKKWRKKKRKKKNKRREKCRKKNWISNALIDLLLEIFKIYNKKFRFKSHIWTRNSLKKIKKKRLEDNEKYNRRITIK